MVKGEVCICLNVTDRAISSNSFITASFAQRIARLRQERSYKALTLSLTSEALAPWKAPLPHYPLQPRGYSYREETSGSLSDCNRYANPFHKSLSLCFLKFHLIKIKPWKWDFWIWRFKRSVSEKETIASKKIWWCVWVEPHPHPSPW